MYSVGTLAEVAKEMRNYKLDLLAVSEVRWTGCGNMKLSTGEQFIYSGSLEENATHHKGVGIMMTRNTEKALIEWEPMNERIIRARFNARFRNVSVISVYAPTNDTNRNEKDSFYEQL